jgi:hypothetical protein
LSDTTWYQPNDDELELIATPETNGLFEVDENGDVMPATSGTDTYFDLDGEGDIEPIWNVTRLGSGGAIAGGSASSVFFRFVVTGIAGAVAGGLIGLNTLIAPMGSGGAIAGGSASVEIKEVEDMPSGGGVGGGSCSHHYKVIYPEYQQGIESTWEEVDGDLQLEETPETDGLFEVDENGDVMPATSGVYDHWWDLDGNGDVQPSVTLAIAGGSADVICICNINAVGGGIGGGAPAYEFNHRYIVSGIGGAIGGGSASQFYIVNIVGVAGGIGGGSGGVIIIEVEDIPSGGAVAGGTAEIFFSGDTQWTSGSVIVTKGSKTVTGKETTWMYRILPGMTLKIKNEPVIYEIAVVIGNEELTLVETYEGTTKTDYEYQITRSFTTTLNLMETVVDDIDIQQHLTLELIRKLDVLFGTQSIPQFAGVMASNSYMKHNKLITTISNPVKDTWYDAGITLISNEGFSASMDVLYKDSVVANNRTCYNHIGGYNGGTCTPTYLSRPNGNDIEVRIDSNKLQVRQTVNSSSSSKMTVKINFLTHEVV